MAIVYTVREFRAKVRQALDRCTHESVYIDRNGEMYELRPCTHGNVATMEDEYGAESKGS